MKLLLAIAAGGALGSVARWWLQGMVQRATGSGFPWGTFAVNVSGGLAIGFLAALIESRSALAPEGRAFVLVGLLGGFTTFSTYLYESDALLRGGRWMAAVTNLLGSSAAGLVALWIGVAAARWLAAGGRG